MSHLRVECTTCHKSWDLDVGASILLQLELCSCPCPCCEAYTLSCSDPDESRPAPRPGRAARRARLVAGVPFGRG